jgi:hypothetical protein
MAVNMKTSVIIPIHKQVKYFRNVFNGLLKQSKKPDVVYVVMDRPELEEAPEDYEGDKWDAMQYMESICSECTDIEFKILSFSNIPNNIKRQSENIFLTGMARNIGTETAIQDGCGLFIYIDGDCVPQKDLVASHISKSSDTLPVLSVARRRERKYRWMDQRETIANISHLQLFSQKGMLVNDPTLLKECLIVWSCNMSLNLAAVKLIRKFNLTYYNRSELFNSNFLGAWGGEDSFLGIQAWYCRIYIQTIGDGRSGVEHIDHPRPKSIYNIDHKKFFEQECDTLRHKVRVAPLRLDFFL